MIPMTGGTIRLWRIGMKVFPVFPAAAPLAEAFNGCVTWEMLVRMDALGDQSGAISRACFLGSEQDGGWAFYNSPLASCFSYQHKSGVKSSVKSIAGDSILVPGKFYHLVVTMDRLSHTMRYFVNGKLVCTGTRAGTDMVLPQCGSPKGRRNMWICLGGDATDGTFSGGAENSTACSFVFARIYGGALSQKAAQSLYDDEVKRFTEPQTSHGTELIMDLRFTPDGMRNHAPSFRDTPIEMAGDVPIAYNAGINLYESKFNKDKTQFLKYFLGDDPAIMSQMADEYSVEVFCRNSDAPPSAITRPLGFANNYGFGLSMSTKGVVSYMTATHGAGADGNAVKTLWTSVGDATVTDSYTHYVIVYDRRHYTSRLYINGELASTRWLTFKECPLYEWTPSVWMAVGGDAHGTYSQAESTGNYPFMGEVAVVRIYGRALSTDEVQSLRDIIVVQEQSYTLGTNGYAAVCLPFAWQVPEGCTAFIVTEIASPSAMMEAVAEAGECVPYGMPVLLQGTPKATVILKALDISQVPDSPASRLADARNLLAGTYPGRSLAIGEGYYMRPTSANIYRASTAVSLPPFSCYLPLAEKRTYFKLEETPDGLNDPKDLNDLKVLNDLKDSTAPVFNMSGQRVANGNSPGGRLPKGIYVRSGRKVVVK